jgi:hypothetical protein
MNSQQNLASVEKLVQDSLAIEANSQWNLEDTAK